MIDFKHTESVAYGLIFEIIHVKKNESEYFNSSRKADIEFPADIAALALEHFMRLAAAKRRSNWIFMPPAEDMSSPDTRAVSEEAAP